MTANKLEKQGWTKDNILIYDEMDTFDSEESDDLLGKFLVERTRYDWELRLERRLKNEKR